MELSDIFSSPFTWVVIFLSLLYMFYRYMKCYINVYRILILFTCIWILMKSDMPRPHSITFPTKEYLVLNRSPSSVICGASGRRWEIIILGRQHIATKHSEMFLEYSWLRHGTSETVRKSIWILWRFDTEPLDHRCRHDKGHFRQRFRTLCRSQSKENSTFNSIALLKLSGIKFLYSLWKWKQK
jgi:hypothetical protein